MTGKIETIYAFNSSKYASIFRHKMAMIAPLLIKKKYKDSGKDVTKKGIGERNEEDNEEEYKEKDEKKNGENSGEDSREKIK